MRKIQKVIRAKSKIENENKQDQKVFGDTVVL
jgi:hypothetical protein